MSRTLIEGRCCDGEYQAIGVRSITTSAYEKLLTVFGMVKKDCIRRTSRDLILPFVRDGDFASFYGLDRCRDGSGPVLWTHRGLEV